MTHSRRLVAVALLSMSMASAAPGSNEPPFLRWTFTSSPIPNDTARWFFQDSVERVDGRGAILWTRRLPERMRRVQAGMGAEEIDAYRRAPRETRPLAFLIGLVETEDAVVISDASGLLALSTVDGAVRLDWNAQAGAADAKERLWFDRGTFQVSGAVSCGGEARGGRFLASCGGRLVYFNGSTAAVVSEKGWEVVGSVRYEARRHDLPARPAERAARLTAGDLVVTLRGAIFLR